MDEDRESFDGDQALQDNQAIAAGKPCVRAAITSATEPEGQTNTFLLRVMQLLHTTPELMFERHPNPWFVLWLTLCCPATVFLLDVSGYAHVLQELVSARILEFKRG